MISVPDEVSLRKVDLAVELQILSFYQQRRSGGPKLARSSRRTPTADRCPSTPGPTRCPPARGARVLVVGGGAVAAAKVRRPGGRRRRWCTWWRARSATRCGPSPSPGRSGPTRRARWPATGSSVASTDDPGGERAGVPRRRGGGRVRQRRRRPRALLGHPPGPPRPGSAAGHGVDLGPQPGAGRMAPRPPRRGGRTRARGPPRAAVRGPCGAGRRGPRTDPPPIGGPPSIRGCWTTSGAGRPDEARERLHAALGLVEPPIPGSPDKEPTACPSSSSGSTTGAPRSTCSSG